MLTSLASLFTQRLVKPNLAMTGEITLRGKVLPVGGIKEKVLAAVRAGIDTLIMCKDNEKDVSEIKEEYTKGLTFHYVSSMDEVIRHAIAGEEGNDISVTGPAFSGDERYRISSFNRTRNHFTVLIYASGADGNSH